MDATTIKLDASLHAAIRRLKPPNQSLTGYVRDLVAREEKRTALESAGAAYAALLVKKKEEAEWLAAWDATSLSEEPEQRRR